MLSSVILRELITLGLLRVGLGLGLSQGFGIMSRLGSNGLMVRLLYAVNVIVRLSQRDT
jgi:hypothetical protein